MFQAFDIANYPTRDGCRNWSIILLISTLLLLNKEVVCFHSLLKQSGRLADHPYRGFHIVENTFPPTEDWLPTAEDCHHTTEDCDFPVKDRLPPMEDWL